MGDLRGLADPGHRQAERAVRLSDLAASIFAGGRVADLVLLALAVEFAWLVSVRRRRWAGVAAALLPGALLVIALRLALTGADARWIALALAASFPAHVVDLARRPIARMPR